MKLSLSMGVAVSLSACIPSAPPAPPVPHEAMGVSASAAKTWDAVIDVFAAKNIPIKTLDHSSGFIAAEEMSVPAPEGRGTESPYADCGSVAKMPQVPTHANYNIRVKGDSIRSTVQVTVLWKHVINPTSGSTIQCSTKGTWETDAETEIKRRAESR
jgi:hypothetical protein